MVTGRTEEASQRPRGRSAQREQTRVRILEAVLSIAVEEGMRAVRHRAVAQRAGVALGSTTYHFSSIEELIISAFDYWRSARKLVDNPFYKNMLELLEPFANGSVPVEQRREFGERILENSVGYLVDQLTTGRQDRVLELAFYHESMRYESLREMVMESWQSQLEFLEHIHSSMGSSHPREDATLTSSLFRQLEQTAVLEGSPGADEDLIRRTLGRHMELCFQADLQNA